MLLTLTDVGLTLSGKSVLSDISMNIGKGAFISILGPSGGGKSSLLRILNGLQSPTEGFAFYNGADISSFDPIELRKKIGLVFQTPVMIPGTVRNNLVLPFQWNKRNSAPNDSRLGQILELVGLDPNVLEQDGRDLSGGEKQRISLARTLLNEPEVLLLDEPTASLDPGMASRIVRRVARLHEELNLTTVLVSHQHNLVRKVAEECYFIMNGKIIESGSIGILDAPQTDEVKQFLEEEEE